MKKFTIALVIIFLAVLVFLIFCLLVIHKAVKELWELSHRMFNNSTRIWDSFLRVSEAWNKRLELEPPAQA